MRKPTDPSWPAGTFLAWSARRRLTGAALVIAGLWLAVTWALS